MGLSLRAVMYPRKKRTCVILSKHLQGVEEDEEDEDEIKGIVKVKVKEEKKRRYMYMASVRKKSRSRRPFGDPRRDERARSHGQGRMTNVRSKSP